MNKGFTLVELLIVLAISTFLIGLALVGTQNTQAQITLNSAAASFISNVNFVKNSAMSGSVQLGSDSVSPQSNWVYGFGILPGTLGINSTDGCTVTAQCATGYYTAIFPKNVTRTCSDSATSDTSPPSGNSLSSVKSLIDCSFAGGVVGGTVFPPPTPSDNNWYYYQSLPLGVTLSISPYNRFPIFQELTGEIYIYDTGTGDLISSKGIHSHKTIFTLSYEGYSIPITFYDLYYNNGSSNNANTFHEGNIAHG
jgi:prepilin-type N-terminal cleavage/methylation domain-containing protein